MDFFCLVLSANKDSDDWFLLLYLELSFCDLLYVEGEMSDFWKLRLSGIYIFLYLIYLYRSCNLRFAQKFYLILDCESVVLVYLGGRNYCLYCM